MLDRSGRKGSDPGSRQRFAYIFLSATSFAIVGWRFWKNGQMKAQCELGRWLREQRNVTDLLACATYKREKGSRFVSKTIKWLTPIMVRPGEKIYKSVM